MIKKASTIEIKKAIEQLPIKERNKLINDLQNKFFASRLQSIRSLFRSKVKTTSFKKITKITEKVRQELYEKRLKSHS